jgi:hypothetical protein
MPLSQLPTHHPACSKDVKAACGSNVAARHALCHLGANATTTFGRATSGGQLQRHSGARCWLCARLSRPGMSRRNTAWAGRATVRRGRAAQSGSLAGHDGGGGGTARMSDDRDARSACGSGTGAGIRGTSEHPSFEEPAACFRYGIRATELVRKLCA